MLNGHQSCLVRSNVKRKCNTNLSFNEIFQRRKTRKWDMWQPLLQNAETAHRIVMRSAHNKNGLEEKLRYISSNPPPILSISNYKYGKHLQSYKPRQTPVLNVEQTNIPALRRIISIFPNKARLNEIKQQQIQNLPSLLNKVALYTEQSMDIVVHDTFM